MTEEDLLTVRAAALLCNRSEETIRRWIWSGRLSSRKLGNQHFISRADLDAVRLPSAAEAKAKYGVSHRNPQLFEEYGYSPLQAALEEQRGRVLASAEEEARQILEDEAFQDEIATRFGQVDVLCLLDREGSLG
jgi:excisionase family DNA binding protein